MTRTLLVVALLAGVAHADGDAAGRKPDDPIEAGRRAYRLGLWDEAIQDWTRAYEVTGQPEILFNIGQAWTKKGDHERAIFFFQSYLHALPAAPNRADVEALIASLTPASQPASQPSAPPRAAPRRQFLVAAGFGVAFPAGDYDPKSVGPSPSLSLEFVWFPIRWFGVVVRGRWVPELTGTGYSAHALDGELGPRGELPLGAGFGLHAEAALIYASETIASSTVNGSATGWGVVVRGGASRAFGRVVVGLDVGWETATISSAAFGGNTTATWFGFEATGGVAF